MSSMKPDDGWLVLKCDSARVEKLFGLMGQDEANARRANFRVDEEDSEYFVPLGARGFGASIRVLVSLAGSEPVSRYVELDAPDFEPIRLTIDEALGMGQALIDAADVARASDLICAPDDVATALDAVRAAKRSEK